MAYIRRRVGAKGTSYTVSIRRRGQPPIHETFATKTEAQAFARRIDHDIDEGKHAGLARVRRLSDLLEQYERSERFLSLDTRSDRQRMLNWWRERCGHKKLSQFRAEDIAAGRDALLSEPYQRVEGGEARKRSTQTTRHYVNAISAVLEFGRADLHWIDKNAAADVRKPASAKPRVRWLTDEERDRLVAACGQSDNPDILLIVLLALTSGARKGEIERLRWPQIDLKQGVAWLTVEDTKTEHARAVPLVGRALALLRERSKVRRLDSDLVFPAPENPSKPRYSREAWRMARKRAGLNDFRFHDLRHSAATELLRAGVDSRIVAATLGHRTLAMMQRYQHVAAQTIVDAAQKAASKTGL
jgi:integrase